VEAAAIDLRRNLSKTGNTLVTEGIPEVRLLFVDVQQIVAEDFLCQSGLDILNALLGQICLVMVSR